MVRQGRLAEFPDQVESEKLQGNERDARGAVGQHAGRTNHQHGVLERSIFVLAGDQAVRARERQLHRSEKLITMISAVITFRNILRLKLAQPSTPSASRIAISAGRQPRP